MKDVSLASAGTTRTFQDECHNRPESEEPEGGGDSGRP